MARYDVIQRRARALVSDVKHINIGGTAQHLDRQIRRGAAGSTCGQLTGPCLGQCDKFLDAAHRQRRMHQQHILRQRQLADHGEVLDRVKWQFAKQAGVDRVRRGRHQHGVTIGRRARHEFRADIGGCARAVLDDHALPKNFGELGA